MGVPRMVKVVKFARRKEDDKYAQRRSLTKTNFST